MNRMAGWSEMITKAEKAYGIDINKIHLLGIAEDMWSNGYAVCVTELINKYTGASRATTHKAIKELVSAGLLRMVDSDDDKRVRYLEPGKNLQKLERLL